MTLIKSISGIRGTIGGQPNDGLTPIDIVRFTSAYGTWLKGISKNKLKVVIGRDARISGEMVSNIVVGTLQGLGINVIDLGFSTTPTVEIAVTMEKANGGIILTASHNPKQWNALKLLNEKGEFISAKDGADLLLIAENNAFNYADVDELGTYTKDDSYLQKHIDSILNLKLVDVAAIRSKNYKVAIDGVNSTGGIFIPALLKSLGVANVVELYCEPNGIFPHNPEPLPENLTEIAKQVVLQKADIGFVVDPDVDRLCMVCENGEMFGEEYTLVAVSDYVLQHTSGNTVSNLSSTRALRDVTEKNGGNYFAAAVGEVNVVGMMKQQNAIIGGEGNGGVIYPESHYGRDALVGIALFLTHLSKSGFKTCSELRASYPDYYISKNKIELTPQINVDAILLAIAAKYKNQEVNTIDGVKINFESEWVHLRKSNTEPIIRIYSESKSKEKAEALANKIIENIKDLITEN
ncbi:MAG: phosphoglucosamine mutase [Flavobacteriales bacterium CG_4_10_14_0_2_um_filter_32_8]|nr:MAG: phosphoglucosamine mutase [Flavobacteriales bacterium CG_4_10_14_0_2_um_filter_32_8]PJB14018.1 MAG: phosphoglucosamine mutase [Flavobacteriales bacterium CG_4_9_14_3_um_filter_32_8]